MPNLHKHTIYYYDWIEVKKEVDALAGKSIRDWAGRWDHNGKHSFDPTKPYQDFWHKIYDIYGAEIRNPSFVEVSFDEIKDQYKGTADEEWVTEICDLFDKVLSKQNVSMSECFSKDAEVKVYNHYMFKMWW